MQRVTVKQVDRAYKRIDACLEAYAEFCNTSCVIYKRINKMVGREPIVLPEESLEPLERAAEVLETAMSDAAAEFEPIAEELHGQQSESMDLLGVPAPSYASGVIRLAKKVLDGRFSISSLDLGSTETRDNFCRIQNHGRGHPEKISVALEIEAAQLNRSLREQRWPDPTADDARWASGDDDRPRGELRKLTPLNRRVMKYLMRRVGREVTSQELADEVWGDDLTSDNAIHQGISRLRAQLRGLRLPELATRIKGMPGCYEFLAEDLSE